MLPCAASNLIAQVPFIYMTVFQARWLLEMMQHCVGKVLSDLL